jgi:gamma-tubulin complex component 5
VPFPLSAVFSPASLKARSRIFTLMLQVARARHVLSRLLVLQGLEGLDAQQRKAFVGIRLRLVWIVK